MVYVNKGLACPKCGEKSTIQDNARDVENNEMYRERLCTQCGHVFYTVEFAVEETDEFHEFWRGIRREYRRNYRKDQGVQ